MRQMTEKCASSITMHVFCCEDRRQHWPLQQCCWTRPRPGLYISAKEGSLEKKNMTRDF